MAGQDIAFDVIARDKASSTFSKISKSSGSTESQLKKFGKTAALVLGGVGISTGLISFLKDSTAEAREAQKVGALTTQVIKTTGGAANVTGKQVGDLANAISKKVGIDDEAIQSGENLLLTFKNVRNEAGKSNKIFNQATQASVDLAAGLAAASGGQVNFKAATTLVGKALNDPIKGLTALHRIGVTFTTAQQAQIKALVQGGDANAAVAMNLIADTRQFNDLVKQNKGNIGAVVKSLTKELNPAQRKTFQLYREGGHTLLAQKKILKELKSEFGGAAASQASAADKARVAWKNLEEQVGNALLPVIDNLANRMTNDVVPAISKFVSEMQDGTGNGGELVHVLKDTAEVGQSVASFFKSLPGPVKKYGAEVLIAAVVLNKLNNGLVSSRASMAKWVDGLGPAERQMTKTQKAAYGLGVGLRNIAGAAGMIAVADGAKRSNSALGALEVTAGAAATGFAIGGPLGAGIAGAGAGLFELGKWAYSSGKAAQDTLPGWKDYASTLDGVTAATTKATRAMVLEDLQKTGVLKQTQALNISDRDAVQASMGNAAARKRVSAALADATAKGKGYQALQVANHLGDETLAVNDSRVAYLQKNLALAATKQEAQKIQAKLDKLGRTNSTPNIHLKGAQRAINQLTTINRLMLDATHAKGGGAGTGGGNSSLPKPGSVLGGLSTTSRTSAGGTSAPQFYIDKVITPNVDAFLGDMQKRSKLSGLDGRRRR